MRGKKLQLSIAWVLGDQDKAGKAKEFSVDNGKTYENMGIG